MPDEALALLNGETSILPAKAFEETRLPCEYKELYISLLNQAYRESPQIEGFTTVHGIMVERLCYFFVLQKIEDGKNHEKDVMWKQYHANFRDMIKVVEGLLKELRAITGDKSFKATFVAIVVDIINRNVNSTKERTAVARELRLAINAK